MNHWSKKLVNSSILIIAWKVSKFFSGSYLDTFHTEYFKYSDAFSFWSTLIKDTLQADICMAVKVLHVTSLPQVIHIRKVLVILWIFVLQPNPNSCLKASSFCGHIFAIKFMSRSMRIWNNTSHQKNWYFKFLGNNHLVFILSS